MKTTTNDLIEELKNTVDINAFFTKHEQDFSNRTTVDYLNELIGIKNLTISKIAKNSGIGDYLYKVFSGDRNPSRDVLIAVSFGMSLSLDETQLLLRIAKFAILDSRDKRDGIIIYSIIHRMSIFETDDLLNENNFTTLI